MPRAWFRIALLNFTVAAILGLLLRYAFVSEIPFLKFRNVMHAHSHVAMLGWIYLAFYALMVKSFLTNSSSFYHKLFLLTQVSVVGMFIAFPIQGYGFWSIVFSQFHILFSYAFVWKFWKDLNKEKSANWSHRFIKTSMVFMILSTVGIWAMIPIMATGNGGGAVYYSAVQFYLHFQFNGWFIFAALALFFKWAESKEISFPEQQAKVFYWLLVISCLLTYVLAVTWSTPIPALFWINSIGVTLQFLALIYFIRMLFKQREKIKSNLGIWAYRMMQVAFLSFVFKILIQSAVVVPYIATIGYTIRNFVIGFLHLILLGLLTHFLLAYAETKKLIDISSSTAKIGIVVTFLGFVLSEAILFLQGTMFWGAMGFLPAYYELLFGVSILLPLGGLLIFVSQLSKNSNNSLS